MKIRLTSVFAVLFLFTSTLSAVGHIGVFGASSPSSAGFSVVVSDPLVSINPGISSSLTAVYVESNGFSGIVNLSATPPPGFSATVKVSPSTMSLVAGSCEYACAGTLDISSTNNLPVGVYNITVTGTSGLSTSSTIVTLVVTIVDFSVSSGSGCGSFCSMTLSQGSSRSYPIGLGSIKGFSGNVSLSLNYPPTLSVSLSPVIVSLSSGGSAVSALTVTVPASTPTGSYYIGIKGSSGLLWHGTELEVIVTLAYFSVSANRSSLSMTPGSQTQILTTVTWLNTLTASITLQVGTSSPAVACLFASSNTTGMIVYDSASGSSNQYLDCAANGPVGNYTATVYGTVGPYEESATISITVSVDPSVAISTSISFQGLSIAAYGTLSIISGTISGSLMVSATNSSSGASLFSRTYTITNLHATGNAARFLLNVGVSPYPLSANIVLVQTGGMWSSSVGVTRQIDFLAHGIVDISDIATIAFSFDSSTGNPGYNPNADILASGTVDIVDVATAAMYYGATDYT